MVTNGDVANNASLASVAGGIDLAVTRVYATWDPATCADPTLVIGLTDGACLLGVGNRLLFALQRDAVGALIRIGGNPIGPQLSSAMSMRLVLAPPGGGFASTWGDCLGAFGDISFEDLGTDPGNRIKATFQLTLADCDLPAVDPVVVATGAFDIVLQDDLAGRVPTRGPVGGGPMLRVASFSMNPFLYHRSVAVAFTAATVGASVFGVGCDETPPARDPSEAPAPSNHSAADSPPTKRRTPLLKRSRPLMGTIFEITVGDRRCHRRRTGRCRRARRDCSTGGLAFRVAGRQ